MQRLNRRRFLCASAGLVASAAGAHAFWPFSGEGDPRPAGRRDIRGTVFKGDAPDTLWKWSCEAFLYRKLDRQRVMCGICPNRCLSGAGACERSETCNVHPVWRRVQDQVKQILENITLAELTNP